VRAWNGGYPGMKPPNAGKRYPPEPLSARECLALLDACGRGPAGLRNRAIIVVLWRCGLRVSEALALHPKDVELDAGTVTVLHGKGDRRRVVGIDAQAAAVVAVWLRARATYELGRRAPLFCTIDARGRGRPLHAQYVREMLKRAAARAGIDKRVHPHGLRHTHAFELVMEGVPLIAIRRQLGHRSLAVTERYVDHLAPAQVVAAMQAREWPAAAGHHASPGL
jgi:site-specific recombinase XerD